MCQGDTGAKHPEILQAHTTSLSDSSLGHLQCRVLQNLPTDLCFRTSCPTRVPPAQSALGTPQSCLHQFQPPCKSTPYMECPGTLPSAPASAPVKWPGHSLTEYPRILQFAPNSASAVLPGYPHYGESQDILACKHFSFRCPARAHFVWRAQGPQRLAPTLALAVLTGHPLHEEPWDPQSTTPTALSSTSHQAQST